jgi:hypothetical protein
LRRSHGVLLATIGLLSLACSDPAVKLAYCVEAGAHALPNTNGSEATRTCDLGLSGDYVVVAYPANDIRDEDLARMGLSDKLAQEIKTLRSVGAFESLYVVPRQAQQAASRTTYQKHSVVIPHLLVANKSAGPVLVKPRRSQHSVAIVDLQ